MEENTYITSDFNLACYLYAKGLTYKKLDGNPKWTQRINFVFIVPEHIDLVSLLEEWKLSNTEFIRSVLFKSKLLKAEIKRFYDCVRKNNPNNYNVQN